MRNFIGKSILIGLAGLGLVLGACDKKSGEADMTPAVAQKPGDKTDDNQASGVQAGAIPLDFPVVKTTAQAGDFVLCPPRESIDKGFAQGGDKTAFIYYGAQMLEPGEAESKVKRLSGSEMTVPNAMIVPIRKGQSASPGDLVLTRWQSGSGMQRAIVVEGGSPTEPKIRYLDIDYDNPSGAGKRVDTCKPDTFHKIVREFEVGTTVAARSKFGWKNWKIVGLAGDKVLALGFAGKMSVLDKAECVPLPIKPEVKEGDTVFIPYIGSMKQGSVKKVDAAIGRVFAEIEFGGKQKEVAAAFGDVIGSLPGK